ncbi:hypothetical protein ALT761_00944 [Alteromonas sp. 76-1]|nr:hypothetical protein ALT761_00944 [Alteromonas sp. 76-1]
MGAFIRDSYDLEDKEGILELERQLSAKLSVTLNWMLSIPANRNA